MQRNKQTRFLDITQEQWERIKDADRIIITVKDSNYGMVVYVEGDNENQNKHVYCTNCQHFSICRDLPSCKYHSICDLFDYEDSKPLKQRPMYLEKMEEENYE